MGLSRGEIDEAHGESTLVTQTSEVNRGQTEPEVKQKGLVVADLRAASASAFRPRKLFCTFQLFPFDWLCDQMFYKQNKKREINFAMRHTILL